MKHFTLFLTILSLGFMPDLSAQQEVTPINMDLLKRLVAASSGNRQSPGGGTASSGGAGGAGQNITLKLNWASEGSMLKKDSKLYWEGGDNEQSYVVTLSKDDGNNSAPIFTAEVSTKYIVIPLSTLDLDPSVKYFVQVAEGDNASNVSKKAVFQIVNQSFYNQVIKSAKSAPEFKDNTRVNKIIIKAFALETNGLHYEAGKLYRSYMFADADDTLLRNMRDKFMRRKKIDL